MRELTTVFMNLKDLNEHYDYGSGIMLVSTYIGHGIIQVRNTHLQCNNTSEKEVCQTPDKKELQVNGIHHGEFANHVCFDCEETFIQNKG